jgi:hypothetical protein
MHETVKQLLSRQFEAALSTLGMCIERCPQAAWDLPIGNLAFCQVAFHTLFFTDYYLGLNESAFRQQPFHLANQEFFRDYEELQDRPQVLLYDRPSLQGYLAHCRAKADQAIGAESADSLMALCGFQRLEFSRAELYVYTIRHVQHHAAQLSLRLRLDAGQGIPWVKSGWRTL